jgi:hypothetical protein
MPKNFSQKGFTKNFLNLMKQEEKNKECCLDFLTQVYTEDTESVSFSGLGTRNSPLIAVAIGSGGSGETDVITANSSFLTLSGNGTIGSPLEGTLAPSGTTNGLSVIGGKPGLGGTLVQATTIFTGANQLIFNGEGGPHIRFQCEGGIDIATLSAGDFPQVQFFKEENSSTQRTAVVGVGDNNVAYLICGDRMADGDPGAGTASVTLQTGNIATVHVAALSRLGNWLTPKSTWVGNGGANPSGVTYIPKGALEIGASTGAVGTSPIVFNSGTLLGTLLLGALEFTDDGTTGHLFITLNQAGILTRVQIV